MKVQLDSFRIKVFLSLLFVLNGLLNLIFFSSIDKASGFLFLLMFRNVLSSYFGYYWDYIWWFDKFLSYVKFLSYKNLHSSSKLLVGCNIPQVLLPSYSTILCSILFSNFVSFFSYLDFISFSWRHSGLGRT